MNNTAAVTQLLSLFVKYASIHVPYSCRQATRRPGGVLAVVNLDTITAVAPRFKCHPEGDFSLGHYARLQ